VQEGTGTTVHDERAGGLRAARLGTVVPVPDALDLLATESAITAIFKTGTTVHDERAGGLRVARLGTVVPVPFAHFGPRGLAKIARGGRAEKKPGDDGTEQAVDGALGERVKGAHDYV